MYNFIDVDKMIATKQQHHTIHNGSLKWPLYIPFVSSVIYI